MAQHGIRVADEYQAGRGLGKGGGLLPGPECADLVLVIDGRRRQVIPQAEIDREIRPDVKVVHAIELIGQPPRIGRRTGRLRVVIWKSEEKVR